jgi:hypothetical protein
MNAFLEPFKDSILLKIFLAMVLFLFSLVMEAQVSKGSELYKTLQSKDSILFESAFNSCELEQLETMISENFEFYHDVIGGQTLE